MGELAHSVSVELVDTGEGLLSDSLLVVGEEEAAEFLPLEEVFAMVLWLRHRQQILVDVALVLVQNIEFEGQASRLDGLIEAHVIWVRVEGRALERICSKVAQLLVSVGA